MMTDALLAYFHYSAIFVLFAFLTVEAMLLRNPLDANTVRLIARVDLWFFAAAILVVVSGLMRLYWGTKGFGFYSANPAFHVKVALVMAIGILSFPPTMQYLRWARALKADVQFVPPEPERRRARRLVMIELHIASLVPLLAVFMARGIGFGFA
jgi:putative membrane protein